MLNIILHKSLINKKYYLLLPRIYKFARVAELVDALDSKSNIFTDVWVRFPPRVLNQTLTG